jgi:hypothetical protein
MHRSIVDAVHATVVDRLTPSQPVESAVQLRYLRDLSFNTKSCLAWIMGCFMVSADRPKRTELLVISWCGALVLGQSTEVKYRHPSQGRVARPSQTAQQSLP